MAALRHSWCHGDGEADWTVCGLRSGRGEDLENLVPGYVHVGVEGLGMVVASRIDDEAVIRIHIAEAVRRIRIKLGGRGELRRTAPCPQHDTRTLAPRSGSCDKRASGDGGRSSH